MQVLIIQKSSKAFKKRFQVWTYENDMMQDITKKVCNELSLKWDHVSGLGIGNNSGYSLKEQLRQADTLKNAQIQHTIV